MNADEVGNDWQRAAAELLRGWLSAFAPPTEIAQVFRAFAPPGQTGAGVADASDTPHFAQFTAALRAFAEQYGALRGQPVDMTEAVTAWLAGIRQQIGTFEPLLACEAAPFLAWLEAQTHPILGPAREAHAKWAAVARAGVAHARALAALQRVHLEIVARALDRFVTRLNDEAAPPIAGVRELFREWSLCADETYREVAFTTDYGQAFAACVDSGSALHGAWRRWRADSMPVFDMPAAAWAAPPRAPRARDNPASAARAPATAAKSEPAATPVPAAPIKTRKKPPVGNPNRQPVRGARAAASARRDNPRATPQSAPREKAIVEKKTRSSSKPARQPKRAVFNFDIAQIGRATKH